MLKNRTLPFLATFEAFEKAVSITRSTQKIISIGGGYHVQLYFAGDALVPSIMPALEHLTTKGDKRQKTKILFFDSASTGVAIPNFFWKKHISNKASQRWYFENDFFQAFFIQGINSLQVVDKKRNTGLLWIPDASKAHHYLSAAPISVLLHWLFANQEHSLVHAAGIGLPEGGVLLAGNSGSGKSTTAFACLDSDLFYLADDMCMYTTEPKPHAYSLYSNAKLNDDMRDRFANTTFKLAKHSIRYADETIFFLGKGMPEKLISNFPIKAILLPKVTLSKNASLTPASPSEALLALAPSTIFQLAGQREKIFAALNKLALKIPAYHLKVNSDVSQIPALILDVIQNAKK